MRKIEMSSWRRWVKTLFNRRTPPITTKYHHKPKIECLEDRSVPASITGMAFQDFNSNGAFDTTGTLANSNGGTIRTAIDVGVGNVTVTAYDALNTAVASSTTSGVDGTYTLTGLTTGTAYRVEFSGLPAGYFPGPIGLDSGSTVQYVVGGATKVDVGLVNPNQYSANNPTIVSEVFAAGDPLTGSNKNNAVVMSLPYLGGGTTNNSNTPASTTLAKASQVGAVLGIATSRQTGQVFVAAYTKIHTGYGPTVDGFSGNGSIYAINPVTKAVNVLVNFNQLFGAGTSGSDFRAGYAAGDAAYVNDSIFTNGAYTDSTGSYTSWNAVGKTAFGGMAVSDDGSTLYVMNLANRRLYAIPLTLGRPLAATDLTSVSIPFNAPNATGTNGGTQAGDLQPFAVTFYNGQLYVGIVNSAESTQNAADLHAYVYQVDPQTLTFGSSPIFTIADMTYKRDYSARYRPAGLGDWHPWTPTYQNVSTVGLVYAQPMLSGIAFDTAGNMTLAFRDRVGDQGGNTAPANPANQTATYETYPAGETLRAFGSFSTGWTLENNGKGPSGTPVGNGVNTGFGPGGGQFYQQDYSPTGGHGYVESGSVAQMPGFPDVVVAAYDPFLTGNFRTGGLRFQNTDNGKIDKAYQLYAIDQSGTFGKANGVGGVAFVNTLAPIEIGNYVWNDSNSDGIQNAGEIGIAGVTVNLVDASNTVVASAQTDSNGQYLFSSAIGINTPSAKYGLSLQPNTNYTVRLDNSADYTTGPLKNLTASPVSAGTDSSVDSNGVTVSPTDIRASVTTGNYGQNNHTYDFGFTSVGLSLGNFVWNDTNNDGVVNNGETGLANVSVSLLNGAGTVVANTTTSGAGYYLFTNLTAGSYQVRINASNFTAGGSLAGYVSSSGTNNAYEPTTQGLGGDGTDHGTTQGNGSVLGSVVTLSVGGQTTGQPATPGITDPAADGNRDVSQDFGFYQPLSLGNFVWNDANNDGVVNNGETGLANVSVSLLNGAGTVVANTTTSGTGYYLFTNLTAGNYQVRINSSNFTAGGSLAGYVSSSGTNNDYEPTTQGLGGDGTDHGTTQGNGSVLGSVVSLTVGGQTTGQPTTPGITDPAADGNRDVSQDFGFYQPLSLGNFVWNDANNDGVVNNGETGLANVSVSLLNGAGTVVANTTTSGAGYYLFTNLTAGNYQVRINASNFTAGGSLAGYVSSSGANNAYEPTTQGLGGDGTDHGSTQGNGSVLGSVVSLTVGGQTTGQPATPGITDPAADGNRDVSQDFGFYQPLSLGNFVWNDANNDGVVNNGETGLANVSVSLLNGAGTVVANTTTSGAGYYLFTNLTAGSYQVRINASNFTAGGSLAGYVSSSGTNNAYEPTTQGLGGDGTDHGTTQGNGSVLGSVVTLSVGGQTTGQPATPGITDPAADGNRDVSQDFGFYQPLSLGNFVWNDANNDGVVNNGETGLANVSVSLLNGAGTVVANTTTSGTGYYLFTNLTAGSYQVRINASNFTAGGSLAGYVSSSGTNNAYEPTTQGLGGDGTDHGTTQGDGSVLGSLVTLSVGGQTTGQPATPGITDPATDGNRDVSQDFGFYQPLSLGNFVWNDTNNDGVVNNGETGLANVSVSLLNGAGTVVANTTTSGTGYYLFTNLTAGSYQVRINASNFTAGGSLAGYVSSSGTNNAYEPTTQGLGGDGTDHGTTQGDGSVLGSVVTLSVGGQTTGQPATPGITDPAADGNRDVSQDFGFYQPLSLGNFVWNDTNNDGVVNKGETGLANVSVSLLNEAGTVVANTTTSGAGYYLFTNLTAGSYQVRINASNFTAGGSLAGYVSSSGTNNAYEPTTQGLGGDGTDHGTTQGDSSVLGSVVSLTVGGQTTGQPTTPGITDPAADGNRDVSQDFGFYQPLSLGNFVWNDANNDGVVNNGETGLANVSVSLLNGAGTVVANTTTSGAGYYLFTNLTAGSYQVRINASNFTAGGSLAGYVSSSGTNNAYEPTTQGLGGDGTDHGTTQGNGSVLGSVVSLTVGGQTTGQPATPGITDPAADGNRDVSQDFGFYQPLSLGNFVWNDANNDGVVNNGETGLANVSVSLLNGAGTVVANTTTSGAGYYLFTNLTPGNYQVRINASNFTAGGSLAGYVSSSGTNNAYEPTTQGLGGDGTDHGTTQGNGSVLGSVVTLSVGGQTTGQPTTPGITDPAADGNRDVSQDFGFYQPLSLGNFVWNDANNDGVVNNGETGLANVSVSLLNGAGTVVANTTTSGAGYYLFTNLTPGNYQVRINASNFTAGGSLAGYVSSTGTNNAYEPTTQGLGGDGTDHGTTQGDGSVLGSVVSLSVGGQTTGQPATPGITDPAADGNRDVSQDFGFYQPLSLGNFVWNDTNNDGVVNNGETGLANVSVSLLNGAGTVVANTTTSGAGYYLFTNLTAGNYQVRINASNFTAGGSLAGYVSSSGTNNAYEPTTQGLGGDGTDHGTTQGNGSVLGSVVSLSVGGQTTGQPATPGITDPAADGNRDVSQDFGFYQPLSLGNFVWNDSNNDGVVNNGETGLANVSVSLLNGAGTVVANTTTSGTGYYLFTNLTAGSYQVRINASNFTAGGSLAGYVSSSGTNGVATGTYEPTTQGLGGDGTDHGTTQGNGSVLGSVVALSVGGQTTGQPATPGFTDPAAEGNRDVSQDFGFYQPLSLGNFVWNDANNDGVVNNGETGLANVSVSLLNGAGTVVANTTTSGAGYYLFTNLTAGSYQVRINASNFTAGGSLAGYVSSSGTNGVATGTYEPTTQGLGGDGTDHGTTQGNGSVLGSVVTLSVGGQTTGQPTTPGITDPAADGNRDVSQDFGFYQPLSLGNFVWNDANNDGVVNNGETGLANVSVSLLNGAGTVVANTTTSSAGYYLFTNLTAGSYQVRINASNFTAGGSLAGYVSSTGTNGSATGTYEPILQGLGSDGTDHGTAQPSGSVLGSVFMMSVGSQAKGQPATPGITDPAVDGNRDVSQDFGFFQPLSLGNYVWNDANNNGVVDNGETGLANVSVSLLNGNGAVVATTATKATGHYLFTDLIPGTYQVRINATNFSAGGALVGYVSSTGTNGSATGAYEPIQQGLGGDNTDHGSTQPSGSVLGSMVMLSVGGETSGQPATPGITDPAADGNRDVSQDFGFFQPLSLGNFVWNDTNNDGVVNNGETGLANVSVSLLNGAGSVVTTTTSSATGYYLFTNLTPGTYQIRIDAANFAVGGVLAGYVSSTGTNGSATGAFEPILQGLGSDGTDHGTAQPSGSVLGSMVMLSVGGEATGQPATPGITDPAADGNRDVSQDFGFFQPLSLGNFVWKDTNNNGVVDNGETGLANVSVSLLNGVGNVVANTTTSSTGYYLFTDLIPGRYQVLIDATNFSAGGSLSGYVSSTGTNGSATGTYEPSTLGLGGDNTDHGTTQGNGSVLGTVVTLSVGGETTGQPSTPGISDPAANGNRDVSQDFGFFQPLSLGNLVWNDANNNGLVDAGEAGIPNVTVRLMDSGNSVLATTTTDGTGHYLFPDMLPGTYHVAVVLPANFISSTGTNGQASGPYEPGINGNLDDQDHGTMAGSVVVGPDVTLAVTGTSSNPDANGTANLRQDFGLFQPLSLGNLVFLDSNNNGVYDAGDAPMVGISVQLKDAGGNVVGTQTTDVNGNYLFANLIPGTYSVSITPVNSLISSTGKAGSPVGPYEPVGVTGADNSDHGTTSGSLIVASGIVLGTPGDTTANPSDAGFSNKTIDFGLTNRVDLGQVSGHVYLDPNINGVKETGERPIPGTTITLTGNDLNGNPVTLTTTTDTTGFYQFTHLLTGTYTITETQPKGLLYDGLDSIGTLGGTEPVKNSFAVSLPINGTGINYNFGEIPPTQVIGYVYEDLNQNNTFDPGESGIPNVTINIAGTAFAGTPLARPLTSADSKNGLSTTTDANGRWNFYGLPPGNYTVTEVQPTNYDTLYNSSADKTGLPVTVGNQFNDVFSGIVSPSDTTRGNLNFGEILPANLDPTKRSFFSSSVLGNGSAGGVGQAVSLNPSFPAPGSGTAANPTYVAVGSGPGQAPLVRVFNYTGGFQENQFEAYESSYTGGVRVAVADVNGDGIPDIITGTEKGGGPRIRVFNGANGTVLYDFFAYESSYRGGLFIAAGDINGDGKADLIVSADTGGGPRVRAFSGTDGTVLQDFFAFDSNLRTGVRVATGDVNGDGKADIIATTGAGTVTTVSTFNGTNAALINTFQPFGSFSGGAYIAAGNTSGGAKSNILVTPDVGGGPLVATFNGETGANLTAAFAYDSSSRSGVRVAAADVNGDGIADVIVAPGVGTPSQIKILNGANLTQTIDQFYAFDTTFLGGAYVA